MKREIRAASNQRAVFGSNRSLGNLGNNGKTSKIETPDTEIPVSGAQGQPVRSRGGARIPTLAPDALNTCPFLIYDINLTFLHSRTGHGTNAQGIWCQGVKV